MLKLRLPSSSNVACATPAKCSLTFVGVLSSSSVKKLALFRRRLFRTLHRSAFGYTFPRNAGLTRPILARKVHCIWPCWPGQRFSDQRLNASNRFPHLMLVFAADNVVAGANVRCTTQTRFQVPSHISRHVRPSQRTELNVFPTCLDIRRLYRHKPVVSCGQGHWPCHSGSNVLFHSCTYHTQDISD